MAPPRLCARCRLRPARPQRAICYRCKLGKPPLPLAGFDPTTALPPIDLPKAGPAAKGRGKRSVEGRAIPPFVPFAGAGPADLPSWAAGYLVALADFGREYVAANSALVSVAEVRALKRAHAAFKAECTAAHGFYSDVLEITLTRSTQVAGPIVVAKRRRPKRFLEPALIQQTIINAPIAAPARAETLMRDFFASLDDRQAAMLRGDVLEVPADVIVESGTAMALSA